MFLGNKMCVLPAKPVPPQDYECCQSGCEDACVYEIYRQQKQEYDRLLALQQASLGRSSSE